MAQSHIYKLAVAHEGRIQSTWKEMLLFSFKGEESATHFANATGGMLIRGLVRGAVDVAIIPQEG